MKVKVNSIEYEVPFDLEVIKLSDYIQYQERYGKELDKELSELIEADMSADDKLLSINDHIDKEAISWFSFWTKLDLFEVSNEPMVLPLLEAYRTFRVLFNVDETTLPVKIFWNDEEWEISDFKVNPAHEMSFNEIITSKETMRQVYKLGLGKWSSLLYLACIFFRKTGEAFRDEFIHENSERMELMRTLPLNHAITVSFFLRICVNIWNQHLVSSKSQEVMAA